jgi:hypothetical protein
MRSQDSLLPTAESLMTELALLPRTTLPQNMESFTREVLMHELALIPMPTPTDPSIVFTKLPPLAGIIGVV